MRDHRNEHAGGGGAVERWVGSCAWRARWPLPLAEPIPPSLPLSPLVRWLQTMRRWGALGCTR